MKKLSARTKEQAAAALSQAVFALGRLVRTITLDNGTEFHDYMSVERLHRVRFYFATPYHSWLVGAWHQREHQRTDPAVPAKRHVHEEFDPVRVRSGLPQNSMTDHAKGSASEHRVEALFQP